MHVFLGLVTHKSNNLEYRNLWQYNGSQNKSVPDILHIHRKFLAIYLNNY